MQQDCELLSLARQLPTDCFDIQAFMFGRLRLHGPTWYGREHRFARGCTHICENGPADPVLQGIVSNCGLLAKSGGDLDRAERWLQWLLITYAYVRDSDPKVFGTKKAESASILWLL
jgi:hypothetical protein